MIVRPRMTKPQNVKKCARPGTDHFSSLRWPKTSAASARSRAGAVLRPGAAAPERISRDSHQTRRPATANASTVISRPRTSRTVTDSSRTHEDAHRTDE